MNIGIVDDEHVWIDKIKDKISSFMCERDFSDYQIFTFSDKAAILKSYSNIDLLFLDVELSETENGFQIAEEINKTTSDCKICFLTSHVEFSRLGYKVNAFRYIDKLQLDEIDEALTAFLDSYCCSKSIDCKTADGLDKTIHSNDIIFIETYGRKLRYHTINGDTFYSSKNIKFIAEEMSAYDFFQIQRSYIINYKYILSYDSRTVRMIQNHNLPISRSKLQSFKKGFFDWRRNHPN